MSHYNKYPINIDELMIWKRNHLVNPRTNRKIKKNSRLYKYIKDNYKKHFPNNIDIFDSNDLRDPVSLKLFYSIDSSGNKKLIYDNPENLIIYKESDNIIRCLEKETLSYFKTYDINQHPISQKEIPIDVLQKIESKVIDDKLTPEEKALKVFQMFTSISIFIDYKLFLNLNKKNLTKLNYELKDFYYQNFSDDDRIKIDGNNGKLYFQKKESELKDLELKQIQHYILDQIENILSYQNDDLKFMINYIILGGLSLVLPEVKEYYDNFNFSF